MIGEDYCLLFELIGVEILDLAPDDAVQGLLARRQQAFVNDVMGESVLERVLFGG